jgi:hypothetical protein
VSDKERFLKVSADQLKTAGLNFNVPLFYTSRGSSEEHPLLELKLTFM